MEFIYGLLAGAAIGGVVAIFVYRNNKKTIGKIADKIDKLVEVAKEK